MNVYRITRKKTLRPLFSTSVPPTSDDDVIAVKQVDFSIGTAMRLCEVHTKYAIWDNDHATKPGDTEADLSSDYGIINTSWVDDQDTDAVYPLYGTGAVLETLYDVSLT